MQQQHQITTIFSINPATNKPYIDVEMAQKVIGYHIAHYSKNLLNYKSNQMEDLIQEVLVRLCSATYDPTKSNPKTFILLVAKSRLGNIVDYENTYDKNLEGSDFVVFTGDDGSAVMATEAIGINDITPEDYLLASEFVNAFITNPPIQKYGRKKGKPLDKPRGFKGFNHGKSTRRKKLK